jgi:methyl-accepting chemotaxis protein
VQLEEAYRKSATPLDAIFAAGTDVSDEEKNQLEKIRAAENRTMPLVHDVIQKQNARSSAAAKTEVLDLARPAFVQWLASINGLIDMEEKMNNAQVAVARGVGVDFLYLMLGLNLVAMAIGITISAVTIMAIKRSLGCELSELQRVADATGAGDLCVELGLRAGDTVSILASLSRMQSAFRSTLKEAGEAATNVSTSSQHMASAAQAIASGAQTQAASVEETSASLEEITATVRQSADNSRQANQLASSSRETAEKGQQVVAYAVAAMEEINVASAKISEITSTIDEIAFQTNLLAVNAAVEAARAGEQGRGFAVVAAEVRSLAQRSAGAAKEIKGLIHDTLKKVERGTDLVNKSGETLQTIVNSVKRVTDIVAEISAAAEEQSTGIDQVNSAVTQIDQVTQSNSAQTEELSSTAQSLSEQSLRLTRLVGVFKLSDGAGQHEEVAASWQPQAPIRQVSPAPFGARKTIEVVTSAQAAVPIRSVGSKALAPAALVSVGHSSGYFEEF